MHTERAVPKTTTLRRWMSEAPKGFEFVIRCHRNVTHPSDQGPERFTTGHFRGTTEVEKAWIMTKRAADTLGAKVVVFETPASFTPAADNIDKLSNFFRKDGPTTGMTCVWEPKGPWSDEQVAEVCQEIGLVRCVDPLRDDVPAGPVTFGHLHGYLAGRRGYDPDTCMTALEALLAPGPERTYLFLGNREAERDAKNAVAMVLQELAGQEEMLGLDEPIRIGEAPWMPSL